MPITVQGAGGETFQFPDGTDAATIQRVLQKHYADAEAAKAADIARKDSMLDKVQAAASIVAGPLAMAATAGQQYLRGRAKSGAAAADFAKDEGFLDRSGSLLERGVQSAEGGLNRLVGTAAKSDVILDRARRAERVANTPVAGKTEWEDIQGPSDYLKFGLETGIESLPEMAVTATPFIGVPVEAMIQTGRIGQQRAESDGRTDATGTDLAIAAPFALGSAALERVGLGAVTGKVAGKIGGRVVNSAAGRIATGALGEAGTEAAQSTVEYAGGSVGTQAGFDPTVALDQAVQGAVGGGVTGGVLSVGSESVRQVRRITSRPVPSGEVQSAVSEAIQPTEEDINSPLSTADIVAGRATVAAGMATGRADAILAQNGMPEIGARVSIDQGNGTVASGVIEDAFATGDSAGVKIKLDDGSLLEEHFADLRDAGVVINRQAQETAADIDAELARRATEALQRSDEAPPPAPLLDEAPPVEQPAVVEPTPRQIAPESTVTTDQAIAGFKARTRRAESGGKDNAQNPRSSAQGRYQFTDGTWIATYRAEFGDGESNQQILAKKFDANLQERLMDRLTRDNASGLKRAGLPVTEGSLYLAHFAGIGGATKLMTANPGASVESVLGQRVVNANPFLRGMSANEVVAWAAGKMGGKAPAVAPGQEAAAPSASPAKDDIDPYAMALDAYRQEMDTTPASPADVGPMVEQEPRIGEPPAAVGQTAQEPSPPPGARVNTGEIPQDAGGAPAAVSPGFSGDVRGEPINKLWTRFNPESGTLGIARKEMPQIAAENRGAMVNFLTARGVSNQEAVVPAASLKPTQAEFSEQKVRKAANYKGGDRAILVSSDGYLLDGHHQWMAARDAGKDVRVIRLDAPIEDLIRTIADMPSAKTASGKDVAAPVKRARQSIDTNSVAITPTGREVPVEYAVVDASGLITSHTQDGYVNPDFPAEKQPRDRSRGTSQAQIAEIAAKLDPRLLGISVKASDGAPIISPEGVVESGNGRALAIARAYQNGGPQADAYRRFIAEQGFNTEGMVQPVLVRVRSRDMAPEDVLAFTREANQRDTAGFSATEQAVSDAAALPDSALGLYRGGDIDMAGNREFVRKFMDAVVPATERANMVSADGSISQDAMRRIGAALLQRAYSNENLVAKLSESTDSNIKAIGGALADVSGAWASMRAAAKDGTIDPAMDITDSLNEAVDLVDKARRDGVKVADLVNQRDIFSGEAVSPLTEAMLRLMFRNPSFTQPVGRAKLAERLNWYVEQAMLSSAEAGLFGPADVVAPGDVLATAQEKFGEQQTGRQEGLFSRPEQADAGDGGGIREGSDPGDGRGEGVSQQPRDEGGIEEQLDTGGQPSEITPELQQRLDALNLDDKVTLAIRDVINGDPRVAGSYRDRVITVAMASNQLPEMTLNHEVVHAAKALGLFRSAEWNALSKAARADRKAMTSIGKRYPDLTEESQVEEAIADRYMQWAAGRQEKGLIARAFDRVRDFLRGLGQALRGEGFTTADAAMRALDGGEVGARTETNEDTAERFSIPEALPDAGHNFDDYSATVSPQTRSLLEGISGGDLQATQTKLDDWRVWLQDKMLYVRRLQDTLRGANEGETPDSQNPYLAEELMTGRAGARLEALADETIEPLFAAMHDTKTTVDELETYLYARHAAERNAHIAKINPEFTPGEGSGMTDIQARAILARVARDGKADTMNALSAYVDRMLSQAVQTRVDAGLLSAEEAAAWADTYKHYVPLRGKREVDGDAKTQKERVNSMSGQSVRGKESKRAFGRRSEADSILAYSILQAEEAIIRAEKNRVATAFLNLAEANPDDSLWTINKVVSKQRINPTTGLAERYVVNQLTAEDAPYTVSAKVDGKERRVTMNRDNPLAVKVAEAMRNLEDPKFNGFMAAAATFNRYFSAINTRFNPTFVITNALRDLQTAAVIGQQFDIPGFTSKIVRDYKGALTASKNGTGEWSRWRREWELSGGKVYYNQTGDLDQIKKDLQRHAKRLSQPNVAAKVWTSTFDALEAMNEAVERAVRLAVYKNAREAGKSKPQAASMARNITVNFTRKGRLGPAFNAFFAFFNASTQGSANLIMAATKSRKVRSVMGGFIVAGFLSDVLNSMLSGDDDDGEAFWDKLPDYEKSRNIVLMLPDGDNGQAIKIPLAYGLNALFGLGRNASAMMRGALTPGAAIGASALEFADAFNPIGGGGSWLNIVAPTALDPFVDVTMNADFTGKPIQPEQNPFEPDVTPSSNYYNGVPGWAKSVAKGLNSATGGDDVLPGAVSVSPEVVDYAAGFLIGGAGRFVKDISTLALSPFDPEAEIELRDIPFAKQVAASKSTSVDKSRYYERVNEVKAVLDHAKEYQDRGDRESLSKFVDDNRDIGQMGGITKEASKLMSGIRKARNEASFQHELGNIDDAAYAAVVKQARENEEVVISAYNKRWMETVEGE